MTLPSEVYQPHVGALVTLFEIDAREIGTANDRWFFIADAPAPGMIGPGVIWQGEWVNGVCVNPYLPFPLQAEGFAAQGTGESPRPTLRIAKLTDEIKLNLRRLGYFIGARFIRRRTLVRYLDAANWAAGNPHADPTAGFPDQVWQIDRKAAENRETVEFELASPLDLNRVMLPRRQINASLCGWTYRVWNATAGAFDYTHATCPYTGAAMFDAQGTTTADPTLDRCSKRLESGCVKRYGRRNLPFGGYPGTQEL